MKTILTLLSLTLSLLSSHVWSQSQVTVHLLDRGETLQIDNIDTLSQLATHPALMNNSGWPGAVIATPAATAQAQRDREQVLQALSAWANQADDVSAATFRHVKQQLQPLRVTGRQFITLDPDEVRTDPAANLRLNGDYVLYSAARPDTITLFGAISRHGAVAWRPGTSVAEYLAGNPRLSGADSDTVMLISPDGRTERAPVAYWNRRHVEAEPGSILWVGFSGHAFRELNQQIVSLLARRVPE
jgi:Capsule biosynthesis GfcC